MNSLKIPILLIFILNILVKSITDLSTLSNINSIKQTHLNLNLTINFDEKMFEGVAHYDFEAVSSVDRIILDTFYLNILYVVDSKSNPLSWYFDSSKTSSTLGTPLVVRLRYGIAAKEKISLKIYYQTNKEQPITGIQWLSPEMTFGKKYPYVYTQGEPIYARSIFPTQDSPFAKITVKAALKVKNPFVALFSGVSTGSFNDGVYTTYTYTQKIPIPSYLVAIAVGGELEYRKLGDRTGVWAEKIIVDKAKEEFSETENFIKTVN